MRFRRTFFSALAPLLGMSALMTAMAAGPDASGSRAPHANNTLVRLIHSVIHLVAPAEISSVSAAPQRTSPRAVLPLLALAPTPLGHSLWMVTGPVVSVRAARLQQRALLRC